MECISLIGFGSANLSRYNNNSFSGLWLYLIALLHDSRVSLRLILFSFRISFFLRRKKNILKNIWSIVICNLQTFYFTHIYISWFKINLYSFLIMGYDDKPHFAKVCYQVIQFKVSPILNNLKMPSIPISYIDSLKMYSVLGH